MLIAGHGLPIRRKMGRPNYKESQRFRRIMRSEFSARTKRIIAGRAGYECSFPGCGRVTIGPGAKSDQIESTGVAAHIFPASPAGPRKVGTLDPANRKSPENGIWLCVAKERK